MQIDAQPLTETIVAQATPAGPGAIAIVRLSGPRARDICRVLAPSAGPRTSHMLTRVTLCGSDGAALDDAMVVEMHEPRSYTGEDMVEFHLHGAAAIVDAVLRACEALGARQAGPGEFTQRAFLHGRIDLAQAEAVADLILADSEDERHHAMRQLQGGLSDDISAILAGLEEVLVAWQAVLDFPEYPTGEGLTATHPATLEALRGRILGLCAGGELTPTLPPRVVLCGPPNAGKSTLLNAWAGHSRALVDPTPGTTRDPIEVALVDGQRRWSVCDTAGMRLDARGLEARGVEMSHAWARKADLVLWLAPADRPLGGPVPGLQGAHIVGSKSDLASDTERQARERAWTTQGQSFMGWMSGVTGEGVTELRAGVIKMLRSQTSAAAPRLRRRHLDALRAAAQGLEAIGAGLRAGVPLDLLALELTASMGHLGSILGRDVQSAVLERIFADFCIGK